MADGLLSKLQQAGLPITGITYGDPVKQGDNYSNAARVGREYITGENTLITVCNVTWSSGPTEAQRREFRRIAGVPYILSDEVTAPITDGFDPSQVTLVLWLDGADSETVTESAGKVTQWDDKSGNGYNVSNGVTDNQPTYADSAIVFDGNDLLSVGGAIYSGAVSVYAVRQSSDATTCDFSNTSARYMGMAQDASPSTVYGNVGSPTLYVDGTELVSPTRNTFHDAANTGSDMLYSLTGADLTSWTDFYLGFYDASPTSPLNMLGNYYEVVIVEGTDTEEDRQIMEGYLAHKWGIEASLPAEHPYKSAAP